MEASFLIEQPRLVMPELWQKGMLVGVSITLAVCIVAALIFLIVKKEPLMLFCLVGGAAAASLEPIADVLGQVFHPEIGQIVGFEALGRKIPLHVALIFPFYFGMFTWAIITAMDKGMTRALYWKIYLGAFVFTILVEAAPLQAGVWGYYGAQPFSFFGMPLWWYAVNSSSIICTAALAYIGVRNAKGWRRWSVIILIPVGAVGFHTGFAAPIYMALNSANSASQNMFPGLVSMVFAVYMVKIFSQLLFPRHNAAEEQK